MTQDIQRSLKKVKGDKIEFLENQSRKNDSRADNVTEDDHKTWSITEIN